MRVITFAVFLCVVGASHPRAEEVVPSLPDTPEANYELGQQFAECAAMFRFFGALSEQVGKDATKEWAENVARGWEVGALFFMVQGLEPKQQRNAVEATDTIIDLKLTELMARVEMNPDTVGDQIATEYKSRCEPLIPLQTTLIDVLRRNNFGAE